MQVTCKCVFKLGTAKDGDALLGFPPNPPKKGDHRKNKPKKAIHPMSPAGVCGSEFTGFHPPQSTLTSRPPDHLQILHRRAPASLALALGIQPPEPPSPQTPNTPPQKRITLSFEALFGCPRETYGTQPFWGRVDKICTGPSHLDPFESEQTVLKQYILQSAFRWFCWFCLSTKASAQYLGGLNMGSSQGGFSLGSKGREPRV